MFRSRFEVLLRERASRVRALTLVVTCLVVPAIAGADVNILTNRYDPQRTGANLLETTLTAHNVNPHQFGKLYSLPVDGAVYAQPLYVSGVIVNGVRHNVLYVATMNDKLYAFDADHATTTPLWTRDFTMPPSVTAIPITDIVRPNLNIVGNVGIQSTPVIDMPTSTIYLVARTKESGDYVQRLHAIDIRTGAERPGSPVVIAGSVDGKAADATTAGSGSVITFDPKMQLQRAGLALSNGVVLIAWAAHEDATPSHGWIMGFNSSTLARVGIFAVVRDSYLGGIWQGGRAPTVDAAGNAYFATGNGLWDGTRNFGDSLLKFSVSRTALTLVDYFTPGNEATLHAVDDDLSGSGFTLLPGTNLLIGGGKEGVLYLLDAKNLGKKTSKDTGAVQKLTLSGGHVMGGVTFWNAPSAGPLVYNWSEDDYLKAFELTGGRLNPIPYAQGNVESPGHPGGSLTISANGSTPGSGIVWASMNWTKDAKHGLAAGILRAYDAETLEEIWNSEMAATRDHLGNLMKFVPPVVADGRVYLPNQNNAVHVYGPLPSDFDVDLSPRARIVSPGTTTTLTVSVAPSGAFSGRVDLRASGLPSGAVATFSPSSITGGGTATITVKVPATAATGTFPITITANDGTRTHAVSATVSVSADAPALGAIAIDFVGGAGPMASTEVAGVIPQPNWNSAPGAAAATPLMLVDQTGAMTGATASWVANGTWQTSIADAPGDRRMMKGYLDAKDMTTTVRIAGLAPRTYDVYVYADGENGTATRSGRYGISGPGIERQEATVTDAAGARFGSSFTAATAAGGNYVKFTVTGSEFTIDATPSTASTATRRAPINGIQIVPVSATPAPRTVSIDFAGTSTTVLAATDIAGVVPSRHWNVARGATQTAPLALVDETGTGTPATVTWSSHSGWMLPTAATGADATMMKGYLDTSATSTTTVSVAGLVAGTYDVYVYADGDNRTYWRSAAYSISGPGIAASTVTLVDAAGANFSGSFATDDDGGNYVRFTITGSGFTLTATPLAGGNASFRAPVNGIQIVPR